MRAECIWNGGDDCSGTHSSGEILGSRGQKNTLPLPKVWWVCKRTSKWSIRKRSHSFICFVDILGALPESISPPKNRVFTLANRKISRRLSTPAHHNAARSNVWSLAWYGSLRIAKPITTFALTELILCLGHSLAWTLNARFPLSLTSILRKGSGIHITGTCSLYETPTGRRRCKLLLSMNWARAKDKGGEHHCTWLKPLFYICDWGLAQSSPGNSAINYPQEKMMGVKAMIWDIPRVCFVFLDCSTETQSMWFSLWGA